MTQPVTPELTYPRASFEDIDELTAYIVEFLPEATVVVDNMGECQISTNLFELPDSSFSHRGFGDAEELGEDDA